MIEGLTPAKQSILIRFRGPFDDKINNFLMRGCNK
jgi:hypothetical protein